MTSSPFKSFPETNIRLKNSYTVLKWALCSLISSACAAVRISLYLSSKITSPWGELLEQILPIILSSNLGTIMSEKGLFKR